MKRPTHLASLACILLIGLQAGRAKAQQTVVSLDSALVWSFQASPLLRQSQAVLREQQSLKKGAFSLPSPNLVLESPTGDFYTLGITQSIDFPTVYVRQGQVARAQIDLASLRKKARECELIRDVRLAYFRLQTAEASLQLATQQDSLLAVLAVVSDSLYANGLVDYLQKVSTAAEASQAENLRQQALADLETAQEQLILLLGRPVENVSTSTTDLSRAPFSDDLLLRNSSGVVDTTANPILAVSAQSVVVEDKNLRLSRAKALPGFLLGYQNQGNRGSPVNNRFQVGLSVPLYFWNSRSQVQAAKARVEAAAAGYDVTVLELNTAYQAAMATAVKYRSSISYYTQTGLPQAETILVTSQRLFEAGEIGYYLYLQGVKQAFQIRSDYLTALKGYQEAFVELNFLRGT